MTIPAEPRERTYLGDGATVLFSVPFRFRNAADLRVTLIDAEGGETVKTLTAHYSVSGGGSPPAPGSITMLTAPATGFRLVIEGAKAPVQQRSWEAGGRFPAEATEGSVDDLTILAQEASRDLLDTRARAIMAIRGQSFAPIDKTALAGKYLAGDAEGNLVPASGMGADASLREDLAGAEGAALSGFLAEGPTARLRSMRSKGRDVLSPADFREADDPDDYAMFRRMFDELNRDGAKWSATIPADDYVFSAAALLADPLVITRPNSVIGGGVAIIGQGRPTITITGTEEAAYVFTFENCGGVVQGIAFVGNGQGSQYNMGGAVRCIVTDDAADGVTGFEVSDCAFNNFRTPYWVQAWTNHETNGIDGVRIIRNRFISANDNSIHPEQIAWNAGFICCVTTPSTLHTARIENVEIVDNFGNAAHIKTMAQLMYRCHDYRVAGNRCLNAGQFGATDDAGGYAYMAYSNGASGGTFIDNEASNTRSIGLYLRGGLRNIEVDNFRCYGVTDVVFIDLEKGGIVMNGVISARIRNCSINNANANAYYWVSNDTDPCERLEFTNNSADTCNNALKIVAAFTDLDRLVVNGFFARNFNIAGMIFPLYDGVTFSNAVITNFVLVSTTGTYGIVAFPQQTDKLFTGASIGGSSKIDVSGRGIEVVSIVEPITIWGVEFEGDYALAGIYGDSCTRLTLGAGIVFKNHTGGTGHCLRLAGAHGSIADDMQFDNVASARIINVTGNDMGINLPTGAGSLGQSIKNLNPSAGSFERYKCTTAGAAGAAEWKESGSIAA